MFSLQLLRMLLLIASAPASTDPRKPLKLEALSAVAFDYRLNVWPLGASKSASLIAGHFSGDYRGANRVELSASRHPWNHRLSQVLFGLRRDVFAVRLGAQSSAESCLWLPFEGELMDFTEERQSQLVAGMDLHPAEHLDDVTTIGDEACKKFSYDGKNHPLVSSVNLWWSIERDAIRRMEIQPRFNLEILPGVLSQTTILVDIANMSTILKNQDLKDAATLRGGEVSLDDLADCQPVSETNKPWLHVVKNQSKLDEGIVAGHASRMQIPGLRVFMAALGVVGLLPPTVARFVDDIVIDVPSAEESAPRQKLQESAPLEFVDVLSPDLRHFSFRFSTTKHSYMSGGRSTQKSEGRGDVVVDLELRRMRISGESTHVSEALPIVESTLLYQSDVGRLYSYIELPKSDHYKKCWSLNLANDLREGVDSQVQPKLRNPFKRHFARGDVHEAQSSLVHIGHGKYVEFVISSGHMLRALVQINVMDEKAGTNVTVNVERWSTMPVKSTDFEPELSWKCQELPESHAADMQYNLPQMDFVRVFFPSSVESMNAQANGRLLVSV